MHRINWSTHSSWIFVRKQIDMDCAKCSPTFFAMKKEELFFNNLSFRTPIVIHCNHRLQIAQPSKSPDKNCNMIGANEPWLGIVSEPGRTSGGVTCWRRCGFTIWSDMIGIGALTSSSMGTSGNLETSTGSRFLAMIGWAFSITANATHLCVFENRCNMKHYDEIGKKTLAHPPTPAFPPSPAAPPGPPARSKNNVTLVHSPQFHFLFSCFPFTRPFIFNSFL